MPELGMHLEVKLGDYSYIVANTAWELRREDLRGNRVMKFALADFIN